MLERVVNTAARSCKKRNWHYRIDILKLVSYGACSSYCAFGASGSYVVHGVSGVCNSHVSCGSCGTCNSLVCMVHLFHMVCVVHMVHCCTWFMWSRVVVVCPA